MTGSSSSVLTGIVGPGPRKPADPPLATRAPLRIRRYESEEGLTYWRWDCANCGEYGGGRHHADAVVRAMRHCGEHPEHASSLLPPARCRDQGNRLAVHPMLFAVDDDPGPEPLAV